MSHALKEYAGLTTPTPVTRTPVLPFVDQRLVILQSFVNIPESFLNKFVNTNLYSQLSLFEV